MTQAWKKINNDQLTMVCEALRDIGYRQTDCDLKADVKRIWMCARITESATDRKLDNSITIIIWFDPNNPGPVWDYDDETSAAIAGRMEHDKLIKQIFNRYDN